VHLWYHIGCNGILLHPTMVANLSKLYLKSQDCGVSNVRKTPAC